MNSIQKIALAALLAGSSLASSSLLAQTGAAAKSADMSSAEVRKVDRDAQKITLKHGEIKSLDMPPMTMVFKVRDTAMLDKVKAGDKVSFSAELRDGNYVVTAIEVAK